MKELIKNFIDEIEKDMVPKEMFQYGLIVGLICGIAGTLAYLL